MAAELRIAGVDHGGGGVLVAAEATPVVQTGEEVCGHGLGRFDLDRDQAVTQVDRDVDLVAGRVAPEIVGWLIEPATRLLPQPHGDSAAVMITVSYFEAIACCLAGRETERKESGAQAGVGVGAILRSLRERKRETALAM